MAEIFGKPTIYLLIPPWMYKAHGGLVNLGHRRPLFLRPLLWSLNIVIPMGIPMGIHMGIPMCIPMGIPMGITMLRDQRRGLRKRGLR